MLAWIEENQTMLIWTTAISVVFVLATLIAAPIAIVKIPDDYFLKNKRERQHKSLSFRIGKNVVGWALIAAGLAMLVLPGQGVIVTIIGVALADFPGKYRLQRWLITRGKILKTANKLRARYGKPPLKVDGRKASAAH